MNMISGCKTFISFSGFSGAHRAGPAFYAASGGWLAFGGKCWGAAAPPVAAAARHWGKASVVHPGAADLTYAAGQWDEGGEHFGLFEVLVHQLLKQCHRPLDSFQSNIVCSSFSLKMTKKNRISQLNHFCKTFVCQVESYVAHIRGLLEERECLTADYERDNEHLRQELHQIRQQQGEFSENEIGCWQSFLWVVG